MGAGGNFDCCGRGVGESCAEGRDGCPRSVGGLDGIGASTRDCFRREPDQSPRPSDTINKPARIGQNRERKDMIGEFLCPDLSVLTQYSTH